MSENADKLSYFLTKLGIIKDIKPGQKFNTGSMSIVDGNTWYSTIYRTIMREGQKDMLLYLGELIFEAHNHIQKYENTDHIKTIIVDLYYARFGIINLLETYKNCPDTIDKLNDHIGNIDVELSSKVYLLSDVIPDFPIK